MCFNYAGFPVTTAPTEQFVDLVCLKDGAIHFDEVYLCTTLWAALIQWNIKIQFFLIKLVLSVH